MRIEKTETGKEIESFTEKAQQDYEKENGTVCNYTPFCFVAKEDNKIVGVIAGATFFSEVYIDELVVDEKHRGKDIGTQLIKAVEDYYKNSGFDNMNTCTNEFQAPKFYEKCGFQLEFVRKNKTNSKLNKYFYVKHF